MLITDDFVFLHVPKTAGTFVQTVLPAHLRVSDHDLRTHAPYSTLPEDCRDLPGFYIVRNPWDWYVSWFHWTIGRGRNREARGQELRPGGDKRAIWESLLRSGDTDFREAVQRACTGDFEHSLTPMIRREGLDLYSAYIKSIVGEALDRPDYTAIRFERLRKSLVRFLRAQTEVSPALSKAILRDPAQRTSERADYRDYYDEELRALVSEKTRWLQERFGYKFRAARDRATG